MSTTTHTSLGGVDTLKQIASLNDDEMTDLQSRLATMAGKSGSELVASLSANSSISDTSASLHDRTHDTHDRVSD
jgi:hypothetical protein